ncbi:MAG TPA: DUF861 domain-containing protein [Gammaproteobacteria bacterium]|nr:DUF861 domain-containing protein [Gammaproteobacteria bacterium]
MANIKIERGATPGRLAELGVADWPIWTKDVSTFPWEYDSRETCYLLEGEVVVTPEQGQAVRFGAGDVVTFGAGLRCTWDVRAAVRKHYHFG